MRLTTLKIVVLPAPFGPMSPQMWPSSMPKDSPSRATTPPKRTVTSCTSSSGTRSPPCASDTSASLDDRLMGDAEARRWHRLEAFVADGPSTSLAGSVRPVVEPAQRPLDVEQLGLDLLEDRKVLLALEGVRRDVGGVLVHVRQLARRLLLGLLVQALRLEPGSHPFESRSLLAEVLAGIAGIHRDETYARARIGARE